MKSNFDFLLDMFEADDIEWLKCHSESLLDFLYDNFYNPTCLGNMHAMLEREFYPRTVLSLWMSYPESFQVDNVLFDKRIEELIARFGRYRIDSFYWKQGYMVAFSQIAADEEIWKEGLKEQQEELRQDRIQAMQKLVDIGFDEDDVKDLEETCTDFVLEVLVEYYLENKYLKKLKILLDAGFHEYLLLQLFVDNPEQFTTELSSEEAERRIEEMEDVWVMYDTYGEEFLDAFLDEDDAVWKKFIDKVE